MDNYSVAILGAGSMGEAILSGLVRSGLSPEKICVSTKSITSAKSLSSKYSLKAIAREEDQNCNEAAVAGADVVIIALKPLQVLDTCQEIASSLKKGAVVISVAAGITTADMQQALGDQVSVIRAMPNTPSVLGLGVTGISKGTSASDKELLIAQQLFETVGIVLVVEESQINALSTVSGSGPAYVFYFAEKLISAAIGLGFTRSQAETMVKATFLGSATLLSESGESAEELRKQVSSPNGTTMQATAKFDDADLERIFKGALDAALARAIELGSIKK
jgi:pyrroline-5-carboxylate reductase